MKLTKLFFALGVIAFVIPASADDSALAFHIDCHQASTDCIELQFAAKNETILVKKDPEMTVSKNEISEAEMVKSEFGQEQLQLRFEKSAAEKFGQVTENNIGKRLVVVANGKALIDPKIQEAVTGGSLMISAGLGEKNKYLDELPWLKNMAEAQKTSMENRSSFSMISYLVLGLLLICSSIYFAFLRKRPSSGKA